MTTESNSKLRIWALVGIVAALVAFAFWFLSKDDQQENYAYIPSALVDAPSLVAAEEIENNGITAVPFVTGHETAQALRGDAAFVATLAEWPILLATEDRKDLRVIATITTADSLGILVDKGQGVETINDLVGKKIGLPQGTSAQFLFEDFANQAGILDQVDIIGLAPPQLQSALERDDIAAMVVWQPFLERAKNSDPENFVYLPSSQTHFQVVYNVVSTAENIADHPEEIRSILEALILAEGKIREQDQASLNLLSEKAGLDTSSLGELLTLFDYRVRIDNSLIESWARLAPWAAERGFISEAHSNSDFSVYIDPGPLQAIDPNRVDLP